MRLIFVDTETNGLPLNKYAPYTMTQMWPHIIQISWQIVESDSWEILKDEDHFLKPRASWDRDAERIHQIPESIARKFGEDPVAVLTKFVNDISTCEYVIAHNLTFDKTAINAEIQRLYTVNEFNISPTNVWSNVKEICTMKVTKDFCALKFKDSNTYKFPRLNELYLKLFDSNYDISGANLHNSKHDVSCLVSCFRELLTLEKFSTLI